MFTGLIRDVGEVVQVEAKASDRVLTIAAHLNLNEHAIGASIACNGVCLTLTQKQGQQFKVMASAETLAKTTVATWQKGTPVNLEPSLRMGDELGGHFVYGHVDATVKCLERKADGDSVRFVFAIPAGFAAFIVPKGSVALNGVSLTVNEVEANSFGVNIIPHTLTHTGFGALKVGEVVNFEVDMLARYARGAIERQRA